MKGFLIFLFLILIIESSCKKNETLLQNEGEITGVDARLCPCVVACPCSCGGLIFHFTDTGDNTRIVIDNPSIFNLPYDVRFPVHITLDWQSTTRCGTKAIKIIKYTLR
jgi:hypothetical protein